MIEIFKVLKGMNNIDYRHLFTFSNNQTRSNGWILELKRFNTSQCGNFFTYKIAPIWNRLPAEAVNNASVEQFKIKLDKVIDTLFFFFFIRCLLIWTSRSLRHLSHCNSLNLSSKKSDKRTASSSSSSSCGQSSSSSSSRGSSYTSRGTKCPASSSPS